MTAADNTAPRNVIVRIEAGSPAWWDLVHAVRDAEIIGLDVSISVDCNGRGDTMTAVKVGEDVWSAHRVVRRHVRPRPAAQS